MSVTVTAKKTVGFRSPYIGKTFQELAQKIIGRDGYLSGGAVSDDGSFITIEPASFISRGIVAESLEQASGLAVPTLVAPWFLLAATPDDDPDSGVIFQVTTDLITASAGVIIAYKPSANDGWHNPLPVDAQAAFQRASEPGAESTVGPGGINVAGSITSLVLPRGQVVDPGGVRRSLPRLPASSARTLDVAPVGGTFAVVGNEFVREDLIVLRQREAYTPEVVSLFNKFAWDGTFPLWSTTASICVPHVYSKRGGDQGEDQWTVYGDGANIRATGGTGPFGIFAGVLIKVAGNPVDEVWVAGQRASDNRVILLYVSGGGVEMLSFREDTGALVDSSVIIDLQAGICRNMRAELDHLERLHIVYEHDEGAEQQVYYTRVSIASASFGTHQVTPKIVNTGGATSGRDDVTPDIGVTRTGKAHIVFGSHAGPPAVGDDQNETDGFVYAVVDQNGDLESRTLHSIASSCGRQQFINYREDGGEPGFVSYDYVRIHTPRITVTVHDEVMVVMGSGPSTTSTLLFAPDFEERLGFAIVNLVGAEAFAAISVDITSDEMGRPLIGFTSTFGATLYGGGWILLDTVYAPNGFIDEHSRWLNADSGFSITNGDDGTLGLTRKELDIRVERGCRGEFHLCGYHSVDAEGEIKDFAAHGDAWEGTPHPNDVYLGRVRVPGITNPSDPILANGDSSFGVFNTRQKKMNYPFLVGKEGDFQGYASIQKAIAVANRLSGQVVIRPGDYRENFDFEWGAMHLRSGVSILGEGKPIIPWELRFGMSTASFAGFVVGDTWKADTNTRETLWLRSGDVVIIDSKTHRILQVLNPAVGDVEIRFLLSKAIEDGSAPTAGAQALAAYPAGNRIENLTIENVQGGTRLSLYKSYHGIVRDVDFSGRAGVASPSAISAVGSLGLLLDHIDFSLMSAGAAELAIGLTGGNKGLVLRGCTTKIGEVYSIWMPNTEERPVLIGCSGFAIDLQATRTDPVQIVGLDNGDDTGFVADTADTFTGVGKVVKTVDGTMHLQDANTRAGAAPNGNIPLGSAAVGADILPAGETSLLGAIFANDAAADQNAVDLGNEVTRATTAEGLNTTAIGNEVTRAGLAEVANTNLINANTAADAALHNELLRSGVLFGCTPTAGVSDTTATFAAGEVIIAGVKVAFAGDSNAGAVAASSTYYFYLDGAGALQRELIGAFPGIDDEDVVLLAVGTTHSGGSVWQTFYDARYAIGKNYQKGPLIVSPETADIDSDEIHFFDINGAIQWLQLKSRVQVAEIIVTGMMDMDQSFNVLSQEEAQQIHIDLSGSLKSLTIRGLGDRAGFSSTRTNDALFVCTGQVAFERRDKISLRVHNIICESTDAAGQGSAAESLFTFTGNFNDIVIDDCSVLVLDGVARPGGTYGWSSLFEEIGNFGCINLTIANNYIEAGYGHVIAAGLTGNVTENLYVFKNTFASANIGNISFSKRVLYIGESVVNLWVTDNTATISEHANSNGFLSFADFVCRRVDGAFTYAARWGMRFFANNNIDCLDQACTSGFIPRTPSAGEAAPYYILNNIFRAICVSAFVGAVTRSHGSVISGNYVVNRTTGNGYFFSTTATLVGDEGYEIISDNHYDTTLSATTGAKAIRFRGGKAIIARNRIYGGFRQLDIDEDVGGGDEGDIYVIDNHFLKPTTGGSVGTQILHYRMHRCVYKGNVLKAEVTNIAGFSLNQSDDCLVEGNEFENIGGRETSYIAQCDRVRVCHNTVLMVGPTSGNYACYRINGEDRIEVGNMIVSKCTDVISFLYTVCDLSSGSTNFIGNTIIGEPNTRNGMNQGGKNGTYIGNRIIMDANGSYSTVRLQNVAYPNTYIGNFLENADAGTPNYFGDIRGVKTLCEFGTPNRVAGAVDAGTNQEV
jgi:hypothetical protein